MVLEMGNHSMYDGDGDLNCDYKKRMTLESRLNQAHAPLAPSPERDSRSVNAGRSHRRSNSGLIVQQAIVDDKQNRLGKLQEGPTQMNANTKKLLAINETAKAIRLHHGYHATQLIPWTKEKQAKHLPSFAHYSSYL